MKLLFCLASIIFLSACLKIKDKEKDSERELQVQSSPVQIIGCPNPNSYKVRLPIVDHAQVVQRTDLSDSKSQFLTMNLEESHFVDASPVPGHEYRYEMGFIEGGSFKSLGEFQVRIPEDLVFEGEKILTKDTQWKYGRAFFKKDSRLITSNFSLKLEVDEVISENGTIETFPASASNALNARSGSNILIQSRTGKGLLNIFLRGENGIDGWDDRIKCRLAPEEGSRNGRDGGNSGQLKAYIRDSHELQLNVASQAGRGGRGFTGIEYCGQSLNLGYNGAPGRDGAIQMSCVDDFRGYHCY